MRFDRGVNFSLPALKQRLQVSYDRLMFARLGLGQAPKKSSLQSTIRRIRSETLEQIHRVLVKHRIDGGDISCKDMRVDSTVVKSKEVLYPDFIKMMKRVIRQAERAMLQVSTETCGGKKVDAWLIDLEHYKKGAWHKACGI